MTAGVVVERVGNIVAFRSIRRATTGPRIYLPSLLPTFETSGLDFTDLLQLDEQLVSRRRDDAATFKMLTGCGAEALRSSSVGSPGPAFNVKKLKSYRDNVIRGLAPTVASAYANLTRATGGAILAPPAPAEQRLAREAPMEHAASVPASASAFVPSGMLCGSAPAGASCADSSTSDGAALAAASSTVDRYLMPLHAATGGSCAAARLPGAPSASASPAGLADRIASNAAPGLSSHATVDAAATVGAAAGMPADAATYEEAPAAPTAPRRRRGSRSSLVAGAGRQRGAPVGTWV